MSTRGKVLVAMSGGVDSSVAAALLLREGFEVVGCFMRLGSPGETLDELVPDEQACAAGVSTPSGTGRAAKIGHQGCCSITDAADARLVAAHLGVPLYVCNFKRDFGRIIDYFVDEYAAGRTPNPCVRCNDWLKFGKLHEYAAQIGAEFVASGHYARVARRGTESRLLRGLDHDKDQSYVLFGVPPERLGRMLLPIGDFRKARVREMARELGLPVHDKPDSQEICFVPDNDYAGLVERRRPDLAEHSGEIVDESGRRLGTHQGQHRFTIGQRRGLSLSLGHAVYVVEKDPRSRRVVVGPRERLARSSCVAGEANWLCTPPEEGRWLRVLARHRSNGRAAPAMARRLSDGTSATASGRRGRFEVRFDEPQEAVAPGQAIVLYDAVDGETVVGGGWIESAAAGSAG